MGWGYEIFFHKIMFHHKIKNSVKILYYKNLVLYVAIYSMQGCTQVFAKRAVPMVGVCLGFIVDPSYVLCEVAKKVNILGQWVCSGHSFI